MAPRWLVLLVLSLICCRVSAVEAYTGRVPAHAVSNRFSVILYAGDQQLSPMVYQTRSPDADLDAIHPPSFCALHGGHFCNRTMSWVEFGALEQETTRVSIKRLDGLPFPANTRILPSSFDFELVVEHDVANITVYGNRLHFMLSHGERPSSKPDSSFAHLMMVFVGTPDPKLSNHPNALVFGAGVHHFEGNGVMQLPLKANAIILLRGAWVEGRINVTRGMPGPISVIGHGVFEGSRFTYHGGAIADSMRFVEMQYDRPLLWDGVSLVHPKAHALFAPPNSVLRCYRMIGWLYNEDGLWIGENTTLTHSFIRTNDDSIRLYAGVLDGFRNVPGPARRPTRNVTIENVVVSQMFNGGVLQIGWEDLGIQDSRVDGLHVTGAEWYSQSGASMHNSLPSNLTQRANDAVVSLRSPVYDVTMPEQHTDLTICNVHVDTAVGRLIGISFIAATVKSATSSLKGLTVCNLTSKEPLQWLQTGEVPEAGENFIIAERPSSITDVQFANIRVAGRAVRTDSSWNMIETGSGVEKATYL